MNVLELAKQKVSLKKVSSTHGGEWQGPCPACGGNDRFHVWPEKDNGQGTYWCRGCGLAGDAIQFLRDFEGKTFKEACEYLNITIKDRDGHNTAPPREKSRPTFQPAEHQSPDKIWQDRAEKFVSWAHENLKQNPDVMQWLADRGINQEAAGAARLGWNPGEDGRDIFRPRPAWGLPELKKENGKPRMLWIPQGLVIPYIIDGMIQRIRIRRPEGEPRYYVIPGSSMATMIIGADRKAFVIIESELDAIACAAATDLVGAIAMGTLEGKPDVPAYTILKDAVQILNALDYGDKGGGKIAAGRAFEWWLENFPDKCDRWPVPKGKDPGEAVQQGIDLKSWIEAGLPPIMTLNKQKTLKTKVEIIKQESLVTIDDVKKEKSNEINPLIAELYKLLRDNPAVKIINTPERFTVLRNDRYVGGRINELVMKPGDVNDYLLSHPDEEITFKNLFNVQSSTFNVE